MGGGWSRYTRGAASGRGTGCGFSVAAAVITVMVLILGASLLGWRP